MFLLTNTVVRIFSLYIATYVLVLKLCSVNEIIGVQDLFQASLFGKANLLGWFYLCWFLVYFVYLIYEILKPNDNSEWEYEKNTYLKNVVNKFKDMPTEEIQKRILLSQLYDETAKLYDKNIKLDEFEDV